MTRAASLLSRFLLRLGVVVVVGGVGRVEARVPERASAPVTFQLSALGAADATGPARVQLQGEGFFVGDAGTLAGVDLFVDAYQFEEVRARYATEPVTVQLEPGRIYPLSAFGTGNSSVRLTATPPAGYRLEINGRVRRVLELDGEAQLFEVRLVPRSDRWVGRAGTATSLPGDQLRWEVALGALANGESARALIITDAGAAPGGWASIFTPAAIQFEEEGAGVAVHREVYAVAQVVAPEAAVNVVTLSANSYEIRFHEPSQVSVQGPPWTFSGEPFVTYRIEQGATPTTLKITRFTPDLTSGGLAPVEVTTLERSGTWPDYTWVRRDWHAEGRPGAREEVRTPGAGNTSAARTEQIEVRAAGGAVATRLTRRHAMQRWGEVVSSETVGTSDPLTTSYDYYTDSTQPGSYGNLKSVVTTGGAWVGYAYHPASVGSAEVGLVQYRFRPYLDTPAVPGFDPTQDGEVTTYDYAADPSGAKTRPTLVRTTVKAAGVVTTVSESTTSYAESAFAHHSAAFTLVTATTTDRAAAGDALITRRRFFREDTADLFFREQVHSVESPDGVKVAYAYQRGTWSGGAFTLSAQGGLADGPASRVSVLTGTSGAGYTVHDGYDIEDLTLVPGRSTLEVAIRDRRAHLVRTESHVWNGAWQLVAWTDFTYDAAGRLTGRSSSDNTTWSGTFAGARLVSETDHTGGQLTYRHDDAGRVASVTKVGGPTTTYAYDAAGRGLSETLSGGPGETLHEARSYDDAGRLRTATPAGLGPTTYHYDPAGRSTTVTWPEDAATRTETTHLDGRREKIEGSAVVPTYHTYGVEADGRQWVRTSQGSAGSPRWQKSWVDGVGRSRRTEAPGFSVTGQPSSFEEHTYAAGTGQLTQTDRQGYAPTRYGYDELGRLNRTGLDLDGAGLVNSSDDRITQTEQLLVSETPPGVAGLAAGWWSRTTALAYPDGGGAAFATATTWVRLSGFGPHQIAESVTRDAEGNTEHRRVTCEPATKTTTITTTRSGFTTDQVETFVNGRLTTTTTHTGLTFTTEHDALERVWKSSDSRGKLTTTTYKYGSGLVQTVRDPLGQESHTFYNARGQVIRTEDAAGKITRFAYNPRGQLLRQWGNAAYPVEHAYDPVYGDLTALSTFRSAPSADSVSWPAVGPADTTTLAVDPATGLLWQRTDAAGRSVEYTYNARGQVQQRFWARRYGSNRVTTTYAYDPATGELTAVTYNDTTPSVSYTYNRLGQPKTVTDSTGTRTFHYDPAKPWRQTDTTLPAFYGGRTFTLLYAETGVVGRDRGFQLGDASSSAADLETAYTFTDGGRLDTLAAQRAGDQAARTFRYGYQAGTDLPATLTLDGHPFSLTRTYHPDLALVTAVDTRWGGTSLARYDYTYNSLYQRATARQSGALFADYGEATYHRYTYNARGELIAAPAYLGSDVTSTAQPLPGRQHAYAYDSIGNRQWANRTGDAASKESFFATDTGATEGADALHQYRSRQNATVPVQGTVDASTTKVAVAGASAGTARQGRYFAAEAAVANATGPWAGTISTHAAKLGAGTGGADVVRTTLTATRLAPALQVLTYDDDGNLQSDGVWDYQWDAENRLVRMAATALAVAAGYPDKVMEFRYDYQGRRVMKRDAKVAGSERRHLLVGWNVVAEFAWNASTSTLTLNRSFTWGLDLVGSLTASGGVGALLQIRDETQGKTLLPAYDGNGNVTALMDAETGEAAATYEYDPFGRLLRAEGSYAKDNTYRFSTKWHDDETDLVYYGHRYYSPSLGRFINRDPIGEQGGLNLQAFVRNDPVNGWDYLGMAIWGGNPHTTLDGSPTTAEGPIVPSITPDDFAPSPFLPGTPRGGDPTRETVTSFPFPGIRQWTDDTPEQSTVVGKVEMSVVLPDINFFYRRRSGALTSWSVGWGSLGYMGRGASLGYARPIYSTTSSRAPNSGGPSLGQQFAQGAYALIPGAVAYDSMRANWAAGNTGMAIVNGVTWIGEQALFVFTLGQSMTAQTGVRTITTIASAAERTVITSGNQVTEATIRAAMKDAPLLSQQAGGVSLPKVQNYVQRLLSGETPPAIKVDAGMVVDGNHRYIAGRILGRETPTVPWAGGRPERAVPWDQLKIDPNPWD